MRNQWRFFLRAICVSRSGERDRALISDPVPCLFIIQWLRKPVPSSYPIKDKGTLTGWSSLCLRNLAQSWSVLCPDQMSQKSSNLPMAFASPHQSFLWRRTPDFSSLTRSAIYNPDKAKAVPYWWTFSTYQVSALQSILVSDIVSEILRKFHVFFAKGRQARTSHLPRNKKYHLV